MGRPWGLAVSFLVKITTAKIVFSSPPPLLSLLLSLGCCFYYKKKSSTTTRGATMMMIDLSKISSALRLLVLSLTTGIDS
jgi:hypothetical protein